MNNNINNQPHNASNPASTMNDGRIGPLPAAINEVNPVPAPDAYAISRLIKSGGKVTGYELSNGQQVGKDQAIGMARNGKISGVAVATNQGTEYLRSMADGTESNNLDSLPSITI